ncbi:uncharacterized protein LOC135841557 [Planococcus citri]|uniref:uncharacterized protein LOC135841557 n=1 Tax=Planococcus citri TaxID=170843 RepID=UPI0031F97DA2
MNFHNLIKWEGNRYYFSKKEMDNDVHDARRAFYKEDLSLYKPELIQAYFNEPNSFYRSKIFDPDRPITKTYVDDIICAEPNNDFPTDFIQSIDIDISDSDTNSIHSSRVMESFKVPMCERCGDGFEMRQEVVKNEYCPHVFHQTCIKDATEQRTPAGNFKTVKNKCPNKNCNALLVRQRYNYLSFRFGTPSCVCTNQSHRISIDNQGEIIRRQSERINHLQESLEDAEAICVVRLNRISDLEQQLHNIRRENEVNHLDDIDEELVQENGEYVEDTIDDDTNEVDNCVNTGTNNEDLQDTVQTENTSPIGRNDLNEPIDRLSSMFAAKEAEEREFQRQLDLQLDAQDGLIAKVPNSLPPVEIIGEAGPSRQSTNTDQASIYGSTSSSVIVSPKTIEENKEIYSKTSEINLDDVNMPPAHPPALTDDAAPSTSQFRDTFRPSGRNVLGSFFNAHNVLVNHIVAPSANTTRMSRDPRTRNVIPPRVATVAEAQRPLMDDEDAPNEDFRDEREIRIYDGGVNGHSMQRAIFPNRRSNIMAILERANYHYGRQIQHQLRQEFSFQTQEMYSSVFTTWSANDNQPSTHCFLNGWWVVGDGLAHSLAREPLRRNSVLKNRWDRSRFAGSFISAKRLMHNIDNHLTNVPPYVILSMGTHDNTLEKELATRLNTNLVLKCLLDHGVRRILVLPTIVAPRREDAQRLLEYRDWQRSIMPQMDTERIHYLEFIEETIDRVEPYHCDMGGILYVHPFVVFDVIYRISHLLAYRP